MDVVGVGAGKLGRSHTRTNSRFVACLHQPNNAKHTGYGVQVGHDIVGACLSHETRDALLPWASSQHCAPQVI